jgi:hypothetical protein
MAQPPNNFFAENIFTIPNQESTPMGAPNVITLDLATLGVTEYSLSCAQFTSYLTYVFLTGLTTGTVPTIYLPSTNSLNGQTVMIKNATPDDYTVEPVPGVRLDDGVYSNITLSAFGNPGDPGAITVVANPAVSDGWYITDVYVQL